MEAIDWVKKHGTHNFFGKPEEILWVLYGQMSLKLIKGDLLGAKAAVKAFTSIFKAKITNGELSTSTLFCAIRLTEMSGAGRYKNSYWECGRLSSSDMSPMGDDKKCSCK